LYANWKLTSLISVLEDRKLFDYARDLSEHLGNMYNIHGIAHMLSERREPNCKGTFL